MKNQWISDRLPTAEDGDDDGDVLAHTSSNDVGFCVTRWDRVVRNQPWTRIHEADGYLIALSDDGAAFHLYFAGPGLYEWRPLPPLPQP